MLTRGSTLRALSTTLLGVSTSITLPFHVSRLTLAPSFKYLAHASSCPGARCQTSESYKLASPQLTFGSRVSSKESRFINTYLTTRNA
jgi:hypothetical protein